MRKLLHLVFAVWKSNRPFDPKHFPWEQGKEAAQARAPLPAPEAGATGTSNDKAVGHKRDEPAPEVVTTATPKVAPTAAPVNPPAHPQRRVKVDFAFLRAQVSMQQVLEHLGLLGGLRGRGLQRRGACPIHTEPSDPHRTFSVHLGKNIFQCFHADCGVQGNVLDFWAALQRLPLYEAALHLAETFHLRRNREEEPVK